MSTTQIAVRLPAEIVEFLDRAVAEGRVASRAALVTSALEREIRATMARHDVKMLRQHGAESELDDLVAWSAENLTIED